MIASWSVRRRGRDGLGLRRAVAVAARDSSRGGRRKIQDRRAGRGETVRPSVTTSPKGWRGGAIHAPCPVPGGTLWAHNDPSYEGHCKRAEPQVVDAGRKIESHPPES